MKLITYEYKGTQEIGLLNAEKGEITPLRQAEEVCFGRMTMPRAMLDFISMSEQALNTARQISANTTPAKPVLPLAEVTLLAPIPRPVKSILCIGKNYLDHVKEVDASSPIPDHPIIFSKQPTSVTGPGSVIDLHADITKAVDYEGELAVIIGKKARKVAEQNAMDHIFGYTILNDVTARDLQKRHVQWVIGKGLDTFCPMGPYILTADELPDPTGLAVQTRVNGELRQNGKTSELIFSIPYIISMLSQGMTLEPGDIIATGTPQGVGAGFKPPKFLSNGDIVEISISGLGVLRNTFA